MPSMGEKCIGPGEERDLQGALGGGAEVDGLPALPKDRDSGSAGPATILSLAQDLDFLSIPWIQLPSLCELFSCWEGELKETKPGVAEKGGTGALVGLGDRDASIGFQGKWKEFRGIRASLGVVDTQMEK